MIVKSIPMKPWKMLSPLQQPIVVNMLFDSMYVQLALERNNSNEHHTYKGDDQYKECGFEIPSYDLGDLDLSAALLS
jgi:hypothetical protein